MKIVALIFAFIVAIEHLYILWLEMFNSNSQTAAETFNTPRELLANPKVQSLFKNQGLYNGFLAVGILLFLIMPNPIQKVGLLYFTACIVIAALFGSATVSKKIFWVQGLPALIALILIAAFL